MLKIHRDNQSFSLLDTPTLADVSITERYDLQEFISNSPDDFFKEIGQELFLLGKEIEPSKNVQDRIDLLAVDRLVLHEIEANDRAPLALSGRVPCKVTDENGPIRAGDLLTISSLPGRAMRVTKSGTVIGTALEDWNAGEGKILVFANLGWYTPDPSAELGALWTELGALRELSEFAAAGADIPMQRGPLMVALRKAEAACKRGGCPVDGAR